VKLIYVCIFLISILGIGFSAAQQAQPSDHVVMTPSNVQWGPAPPGLPPGGKVAVMEGDPSKEGQPFTMRVWIPDGYLVPPHWHPTREHLVVLSGTMNIGMGDTVDKAKGTAISPGSFTYMEPQVHHYAWAKGDTEFVLYGIGPFAITYVNPADDPRNKMK
jgi:mannose-6-phosphate isomerase-like protein (cupin superfamily)